MPMPRSLPSFWNLRRVSRATGFLFQARVQCGAGAGRWPRPSGHGGSVPGGRGGTFRVALLDAVVGGRGPVAVGGRGDLGGDVDPLVGIASPALGEGLGDDALGVAVAVELGGVDEVAAEVEGGVEGFYGVVLGLGAPRSADGPGRSRWRRLASRGGRRCGIAWGGRYRSEKREASRECATEAQRGRINLSSFSVP